MSDEDYIVVMSDEEGLGSSVVFMVYTSMISVVLCILIGAQFGTHLHRQYVSKTLDKGDQMFGVVYILFGTQIIGTFLTAIGYILRTDYLIQSYDVRLCGTGWFLMCWGPFMARGFGINFLILFRTKLLFKGTRYGMDKCVFLTFIGFLTAENMIMFVFWMVVTVEHDQPHKFMKIPSLPKGADDYYLICRLGAGDTLWAIGWIVTLFVYLLDIFWAISFGYLMISRLNKMRKDLTRMYRKEMVKFSPRIDSTASIESGTATASNPSNSGSRLPWKKSTKPSLDIPTVRKLEKVMLKQTILMMVAVSTSMLWGFVLMFGGPDTPKHLMNGASADYSVNLICSWLLFRFSENVWLKLYHCFCGRCTYRES